VLFLSGHGACASLLAGPGPVSRRLSPRNHHRGRPQAASTAAGISALAPHCPRRFGGREGDALITLITRDALITRSCRTGAVKGVSVRPGR
jgi:hypothetical protein